MMISHGPPGGSGHCDESMSAYESSGIDVEYEKM